MTIDLSQRMKKPEDFEEVLTQALLETVGERGVTLLLPSGKFLLRKTTHLHTPSIGHDDGCGENEEKEVCIYLKDRTDFTLKGRVKENGEPDTSLLVFHDGRIQSLKPSALWAEDCPGLHVENILFSMATPSSFFGRVEEKSEDTIVIRPGRDDYPKELPVYCMNRFKDGNLTGTSVTIGFGIDSRMQKGEDGRFVLVSKEIAGKVHCGEDLSWHLSGLTDFLLFIGHCDDLYLGNIRVSDACGFGLLTECCRNIVAERVVIRNQEGYQPVSRDGWKIFRCSGKVEVASSWIEGTRMDGQNVHGNYMMVKAVSGNKVEAEMKYAPSPLRIGSCVQFQNAEDEKAKLLSWCVLNSEFRETKQEGDGTAAKAVVGKKNRFNRYELTLDRVPEGVVPGVYAICEDFTVDEYICHGSVFRNIAGGGNLIRSRKAFIEGNTYQNIMNAGVLVGAEWDTHAESMNPELVEVRDCTFTNVGFAPRYGERGMGGVAVAAQGFGDRPVIGKLVVRDCCFNSMERAIELRNLKNASISGNRYSGVREMLFIEKVEAIDTKE